ncbi:methyltransferase [Prauserella marina]|uniref:Methyltransferase domain-containing protein n=1 Tax=Prauserella marina TaxID=530584 RepID=A0A222VRD9_9PSEU|nr:methyltransferase domain-containing protein [Prauserella marina]ASR36487.1 methyltransferase [Prauserella marina]PWV73861.1 methyltransferase family protein [Prauserella marina]SDD57677.1 Methyltransferase domain-containing protein [Prauserella marina]
MRNERNEPDTGPAARRWRDELAAWRIPDAILAAAPESPWLVPRKVLSLRADALLGRPEGASFPSAWRALEPPGSVLDVGAGAGAASLPLAGRATRITVLDRDGELLRRCAERARDLLFDLNLDVVEGEWPSAADRVPPADVVLCHHVLYNVADPGPFVAELTAHARRLVVVEVTERHPLTALNHLWRRFHGIDRPEGPTAGDLVAVLAELGIRPEVTRWRRNRSAMAGTTDFATLVEQTRRRLCLPRERDDEVAAALRTGHGTGQDDIVTLTWIP